MSDHLAALCPSRVSVKFEPRDIWVGVYWTSGHSGCYCDRWREQLGGPHWHRETDVYVCLLPLLPIHFTWRTVEGTA